MAARSPKHSLHSSCCRDFFVSYPDRLQWIEEALDQYECRLLRYAQRIVGADRAADVVQETFLRLCRTEHEPVNGSLAPWLYTVCRNLALDCLRKESRMSVALESVVPPVDQNQGHEELVEQRDRVAFVLSQLDSLTDRQQECVRLKFQEGLSYAEIAEVTGISASNVGFTLHTAMKRLREKLTQIRTLPVE